MRRLFSFRGLTSSTFHVMNLSTEVGSSSFAYPSEFGSAQGVDAPMRRQSADSNRRMISRKRKLLLRCLSLSLMAAGLSSTSALAGVIKLDGTSGSNQNSTAINTGSGTELQNGFFVDYLVVGGGGSGGTSNGQNQATGGGGGGGFREGNMELSASSHNVTVGAGGAAPNASFVSVNGNNGGNSVFGAVTAAGGGGGSHNSAGASGGSGGGGGSGSFSGQSGGTAQAGQGNNGGSGGGSGATGGGGGGAGAAGASPFPFPTSAVGGAGKVSSITGVAVTYAGGGGGGNTTHSAALGGAGGGGSGGVGLQAQSGTNGLGGGGGGGGTTRGATAVPEW